MKVNIENFEKLYPFKSHFLNLDGLNYHYVHEGSNNDETVIMLHGNPTWSFYYRNLAFALKDKYQVIVPDHIGCGFSDKPEDFEYTLENHINNVLKLIEFLQVKKFHLIVHDWGGAIGFGVASRLKERVGSITILNTAAYRSDFIPTTINLCKNKFFGEFLVRALNGFAWPATFMASEKKLPKFVKKAYLAPYNNYKNRKAISEFVKDIPMNPKHRSYNTLSDIENELPNINCPKLILWGGKDFCFNDRFFNKWREIYPEAPFKYYQDAGHYILEDKRDEVIKEIANFLGN